MPKITVQQDLGQAKQRQVGLVHYFKAQLAAAQLDFFLY